MEVVVPTVDQIISKFFDRHDVEIICETFIQRENLPSSTPKEVRLGHSYSKSAEKNNYGVIFFKLENYSTLLFLNHKLSGCLKYNKIYSSTNILSIKRIENVSPQFMHTLTLCNRIILNYLDNPERIKSKNLIFDKADYIRNLTFGVLEYPEIRIDFDESDFLIKVEKGNITTTYGIKSKSSGFLKSLKTLSETDPLYVIFNDLLNFLNDPGNNFQCSISAIPFKGTFCKEDPKIILQDNTVKDALTPVTRKELTNLLSSKTMYCVKHYFKAFVKYSFTNNTISLNGDDMNDVDIDELDFLNNNDKIFNELEKYIEEINKINISDNEPNITINVKHHINDSNTILTTSNNIVNDEDLDTINQEMNNLDISSDTE